MWNLVVTIKMFLYERLVGFVEATEHFINWDMHKEVYKGKEYNVLQLIKKLIKALKWDIVLEDFDEKRKEPKIKEKIDSIYDLLKIVSPYLWW